MMITRASWPARGFLVILIQAIAVSIVWAAPQTQTITGSVVDENGHAMAGAVCTLSGPALPDQGLSITTGETGEFQFPGLLPGSYHLACAAVGRRPVEQEGIEVTEDQGPAVLVTLPPEVVVRERIQVTAKADKISEQSAAPPAKLSAPELQTLPLVQQKFKAALPLVPGVVRTPDGRINIKGTAETQGLLLVDSAETVDPVTGSFSIEVPIDAIESLEVFKSAYRAEYGRFSGGLTSIETKPPSGQRHFELNDFLPTIRGRGGHIVGIADDSPRLNFTGPLVVNRLNFSESFNYNMVKQPVRGLAWPHNETKSEGFTSFSNFQYIFSSQHLFTVNVHAFPLKREFADINSLVQQPASSNYGQQGFSVGVIDRYLFSSGGALTTLVQGTKFDSNAYGQGSQIMQVTPDGWGGNFFNTFNRSSDQHEVLSTYQFPNQEWGGKHEVKIGVDLVHRSFRGSSLSHEVQLLRADGSLAERIAFQGPGSLSVNDTEGAGFVEDHWAFNEQVAMDLGFRYSGQTVGEPAAIAPRGGAVYSPRGDGKTIFRGGAGIFYDRVPLLAGDFTGNPTRVVTCYDPQCPFPGVPIPLRNAYIKLDEKGQRVIPSNNRLDSTPFNFTWNFEIDQELWPRAVLRLNFLSSRTYDQFTIDPQYQGANNSVLLLTNTGASRYKELESTLRIRASENADFSFSYVHSRSRGDLNTLAQVFVPFEAPVIRPNLFGDLPSNVPNRVVTWGQFRFPWKVTLSPIFDVHTGFPYSAFDSLQNYVGAPNSHRLPTFLSLDMKVTKDFHFLKFPGLKNRTFRGAFAIYNLTDHGNPRDVYSNVTSPSFGRFVGFQHRAYETWFDVIY